MPQGRILDPSAQFSSTGPADLLQERLEDHRIARNLDIRSAGAFIRFIRQHIDLDLDVTHGQGASLSPVSPTGKIDYRESMDSNATELYRQHKIMILIRLLSVLSV